MTEPLQDGIYFGLPEESYFAHPAFSSSGIRWLRVSPLDFWSRSWLNPNRPEESPSEFMEMGKAYHKRIVEGRDAFYQCYAAELDAEKYPNALRTNDEIKARLRDMGEKTGGNKADLIARLLAVDPSAEVWDTLEREHAEHHGGKILISQPLIEKIELSAAMIEKHPQLCKAFTGGAAEVSIFWHDEETGVPMKARLDRLKARAIVDLKTFSNPLGKPIDRAIATSVASGKYHIQAAVYDEAAKIGARYIREGRVFGDVSPDVLKQLSGDGERDFLFVFQQTGIAPVARGKVLPKGLVFQCGQVVVRESIREFARYYEAFGETPWVDPSDIIAFDDAEFPVYLTEA